MLPVDGDDEEVHVVAVVPEALRQFTAYVSVDFVVVVGIIEADGVDDTDWPFLVPIEEGIREREQS